MIRWVVRVLVTIIGDKSGAGGESAAAAGRNADLNSRTPWRGRLTCSTARARKQAAAGCGQLFSEHRARAQARHSRSGRTRPAPGQRVQGLPRATHRSAADRSRGRAQAMTDTVTARTWIADVLRDSGLQGRGSVWRLKGSDVQWIVHIDQLPYGNRLGVDVGLDLQTQSTPRLPTDCPILLHLENLPVARDFSVSMALDLDSVLDADQRRQQLVGAVRALGAYASERLSIAAVREAYGSGDFSSAFIDKDARAALEAVA
jgi:hypothetical protein